MAGSASRITLWGIEVFLATAEEGSVSAAARRLGASPSAVSQQLSALDTALGTVLLNRAARPVSLTPAGTMFRRRAQSILNEAAMARTELARQDLAALSQLSLGVIEDFDAEVTPRLLHGLAEDLPECRFLLETGASHRLTGQLLARELDMVIAADGGAVPDWAEVHPLLEEPFVAVARAGALPRFPTRADFAALPLIQYTTRQLMGRQISAHLMRENLMLAHRFELDSYHAILAMVAAGEGWTILTPLGILRAQRFLPQIAVHPLPLAPLSRRLSLVARRELLQDIPAQVAGRVRGLLPDLVIGPALSQLGKPAEAMRVLAASPAV
ncbi:LysR family transcriptional regulator [Pseudoruegeria sp. SHC-113]|uniref:LysR family transcriptional regulator n=1 Tax=Pseudoruegeria sp. SHC-113 TaxID=2855439 RepID=UPI0021BAB8F6|nr:LysR family transcriptional regulator [Pseudoruegeria sp. SHC-113]MCT8159784.1 LysR family transcriptional regulator [Pseudoruegeria sp. SHC-113]